MMSHPLTALCVRAPALQTLLAKIVALWDRLHVPLMHRSRFFLSFRGREIFYYEVRGRFQQTFRKRRLACLAKLSDIMCSTKF